MLAYLPTCLHYSFSHTKKSYEHKLLPLVDGENVTMHKEVTIHNDRAN